MTDADSIRQRLEQAGAKSLSFASLSELLKQAVNQGSHPLSDGGNAREGVEKPTLGVKGLVHGLVKAGILETAVLPFPYRRETRYLIGQVDLLDLVQSLASDGYFTHFTALALNNLTEQTPKTIYFNVEQRASGGEGQLTQEALNRAFKAEPRMSSNVVEYKGTRIVRVSGRNTGRLGIVEVARPDAAALRVTDIERTLIDATVRPAYSGGIAVVARAFEIAKPRVSVGRLVAYLRELHYVYPYHQAIGFYMERAGYGEPLLNLLEQFPIQHDFYLQHAMRSPSLNERWRLFVPKGF